MLISPRCILMTEILQSMQGELNDRRIHPIIAPEPAAGSLATYLANDQLLMMNKICPVSRKDE